ncbi:hypothetical protein NDU88_005806 [Pleurodeles waltl]|uniref:Uncharacterized protein n=1 Tax=Pleurodeles waltl TaxID=8319 RepID=A0AAV7TWG4_PLEWA|nr:hypothetical protein NDU88_005806 [Pleurodeles waltl]
MAQVTGEELEKLVDGVLPLYAKLYGRPEVQRLSKERPVASHRQGGADPGGLQPAEPPLQEVVTGPESLGQEDRILAVAYLDLDGSLKAAQQPQGGEYQHCCYTALMDGCWCCGVYADL